MKLMWNKSKPSLEIGTQKENIMHVEYYVLFSGDSFPVYSWFFTFP